MEEERGTRVASVKGLREAGKDSRGERKKLSHIALMSSGKKWDTVATHTHTLHTHTLQFSAPRKRGN